MTHETGVGKGVVSQRHEPSNPVKIMQASRSIPEEDMDTQSPRNWEPSTSENKTPDK